VFTGNGSTVNFTLSRSPGSVFNLDVSVNGVTQVPNVDYTLGGTTLTFTSAPPAVASKILARYSEVYEEVDADAQNVRYLPAGVGAQLTNVQAKLRETVSVKDFGAVGDGVADDTAAIQAAINAADGVYFPSGVYLVTSTINTKSNLTLTGESRLVATLFATGDFDIFRINNSNNLTIENLTFTSSMTFTLTGVGIGLHLTSGLITDLVLKECTFQYLRNGIKFDTGTNLVVGHWEYLYFYVNQEWHYECTGEVNSLLMLSCRYELNVLGAIRAQGFTAINCVMESSNGTYAIDTINQPFIELIGCHFESNNTLADVFIGSGGNVRFEKCNFTGPYVLSGALTSNFYNFIVGASPGQIEFHQNVFSQGLTARYLGAIQANTSTGNPIIFSGNKFIFPNGDWFSGLSADSEYSINNVIVNGNATGMNRTRAVVTTNATPAFPILFSANVTGLAAGAFYLIVNVSCVSDNGAEAGAWTSRTLMRWNGSARALVGSANETPIKTSAGLDVVVTSDASYLYVQVTGLAATNIKWTINYSIVQASYI
jgi:hypothetical protein